MGWNSTVHTFSFFFCTEYRTEYLRFLLVGRYSVFRIPYSVFRIQIPLLSHRSSFFVLRPNQMCQSNISGCDNSMGGTEAISVWTFISLWSISAEGVKFALENVARGTACARICGTRTTKIQLSEFREALRNRDSPILCTTFVSAFR